MRYRLANVVYWACTVAALLWLALSAWATMTAPEAQCAFQPLGHCHPPPLTDFLDAAHLLAVFVPAAGIWLFGCAFRYVIGMRGVT